MNPGFALSTCKERRGGISISFRSPRGLGGWWRYTK
jgi:hypothetical protein